MSSASSDTLPSRYADTYRAWQRTAAQIHVDGAIGSRLQGIEVEIDGAFFPAGVAHAVPAFERLDVPAGLQRND
jgi:hypothetical protein